MAKVDAETVKKAHTRLAVAKAASFQAHTRLEATEEFQIARKADRELELAQDCLAGIVMLLNQKVV